MFWATIRLSGVEFGCCWSHECFPIDLECDSLNGVGTLRIGGMENSRDIVQSRCRDGAGGCGMAGSHTVPQVSAWVE